MMIRSFTLPLLLALTGPAPLTLAARDIGKMKSLVWSAQNTATLEFCQAGSGNQVSYGYRQPNSGAACGDLAPLIVMSPGQTYKLTLINNISLNPANIHTHGLHIGGDIRYFANQTANETPDDITVVALPGKSITYVWSIPSDHMGGTHWYHAHVHEHTYEQVNRGAYGLIIIEENGTISQNSGVIAWLNNEIVLMAGLVGSSVKGNGVAGGDNFKMVAGEWYRMRLAAADADARAQDLTISSACEVRAVAHDGVWRFQVPKSGASNTYPLTGSSRLDVAIKCPAAGSYAIVYQRNTVGTLQVTTGQTSGASPWINNGQWSPPRPAYLADLRSAPVEDTFSVQLTGGNINGVTWNAATPLATFNCGTVNEWTISGSGAHPLHLHIHHMQIVTPGGCGALYDYGEYVDTIDSDVGDCTVRFKAIDHCGRTVFHCHILNHEDTGAMHWIDYVGAGSVPTAAPIITTPPPTPSPITNPPATLSPTKACLAGGTLCGGRTGVSCADCCNGSTGNGNNKKCANALIRQRA